MKTGLHNYSHAQKNAIKTFDAEICVSAGAGSGKTSVLVERFLHAVTQMGIDPERILAITFTDKAAGEMKSRLVEVCRERGLNDLRRQLETAYISTIHGFCSRILKENPVESGVDPFFQVMSEGESEILMDQVMDKLFEMNSDNTVWLEVMSDIGEEAARLSVRKLYETDRALCGSADIFKTPDISYASKHTIERLKEVLEEVDLSIDLKKASESELKLKAAAKDITAFLALDQVSDWETVSKILDLKEGLGRKLPKHGEITKEIRELMDTWVSLVVEDIDAPVKKEYRRIVTQFKAMYEGEKRSRASYDFEDLLTKTYELLSGTTVEKKAVRERYRNHFSCILVDEYQDTSHLQDKLIVLLKKENNLFMVGDSQQSIYGFRFADPEIFRKRVLNGSNGGRHIRLSENYRSRAEILTFINALFQKLSINAAFHPLEAKKLFPVKKTAAVQLLCVLRQKDEGEDMDSARVIEARSIARTIDEIVRSAVIVQDKNGKIHPIEYRDIAILFRGLNKSYLYENELTNRAVPYTLSRGGGFYEKPEILDFINFLRLIDNPYLDIALAGVLRSPIVHISDDALYWLALTAKNDDHDRPLWNGVMNYKIISELSSNDRQKLAGFMAILEDLRKKKDNIRLSEILETILERSYYDAKVLTRAGGKQKLANVLKLIAIARSMEEKDIVGVRDFIHYAESLAENEISEGEARITSGSENAVVLSTIHAAKGLEFPYVIIADMGGQSAKRSKENFAVSHEIGLGLKQKFPKTQKYLQDFTFKQVDQVLKEKDAQEEERLIYVAMTRAQEHLILSGSLTINSESASYKESSSWMSRIAYCLEWDPLKQEVRNLDFGGVPIEILKIEDKESAEVLSKKPELPTAAFLADQQILGIRQRLKPIDKGYEETEDHTVTDLLLASWPNIKTAEAFSVEKDKDNEQELWEIESPRNEYGTIFHRVMEYILSNGLKKTARPDIPPSMIRTLNLNEQKELKESILKFWHSPLGRLAKGAKKCYSELPFIYKMPRGILKGQIDLVVQTGKGEWIVIDYKTNRMTAAQKGSIAKEYELQLYIYAYVFYKLYGQIPKKGILYFSVIDDTHEFVYAENAMKAFGEKLNAHFSMAIKVS